jgi:hypothetical protein
VIGVAAGRERQLAGVRRRSCAEARHRFVRFAQLQFWHAIVLLCRFVFVFVVSLLLLLFLLLLLHLL